MKRLSKKIAAPAPAPSGATGELPAEMAAAEAPPLKILPLPAERGDAVRKRKPPSPRRPRLLVMDEHPMVEEWLGHLLAADAEVVLAGHVADLAQTAALVARAHPHLVLLETGRDVSRSLAVIRELKARFPEVRLLVFSGCDGLEHSVQVLRAGASGFLSKSARGPEVQHAVRQVLADGVYLSKAMLAHLAAGVPDPAPARADGPGTLLSQRELEVYSFIGDGLRPKEIAQRISLSVKTVESYLVRIREKLHLRDARAVFQDAVRWSKARGVAGPS